MRAISDGKTYLQTTQDQNPDPAAESKIICCALVVAPPDDDDEEEESDALT